MKNNLTSNSNHARLFICMFGCILDCQWSWAQGQKITWMILWGVSAIPITIASALAGWSRRSCGGSKRFSLRRLSRACPSWWQVNVTSSWFQPTVFSCQITSTPEVFLGPKMSTNFVRMNFFGKVQSAYPQKRIGISSWHSTKKGEFGKILRYYQGVLIVFLWNIPPNAACTSVYIVPLSRHPGKRMRVCTSQPNNDIDRW